MYNVNQYTGNNTFILKTGTTDTSITIPYGKYNVYTLLNQLNILLSGIITVNYNIATPYSINPVNYSKLLGLSATTAISTNGTISGYVNMVNYQQIIF